MPSTTKIPHDRLHEYFEDFTKRFLRDGAPEAVDVEVLSADLGDQYVAEGARLDERDPSRVRHVAPRMNHEGTKDTQETEADQEC